VVPTPVPLAVLPPQRNVAPAAHASASNTPVPAQYWIKALNDGHVPQAPLPPDMWGTWTGTNPARPWVQYSWDAPVTLNGARVYFFNDQPAGSGVGVAVPKAWHLEYWADGQWKAIAAQYGVAESVFNAVSFAPITTRCLRAVFDASAKDGSHAGVGVVEWEALAPTPAPVKVAPAAGQGSAGTGLCAGPP
jgi:hypothetical protein